MTSDPEHNRLFWHSRRGMLELDLILVPFVQKAYKELSSTDQACYEKLLKCEDTELYQWLLKKQQPSDPDLQNIVQIILNRV